MFFKSSLLPSGNPCALEAQAQWFGWSKPFPIPGVWNLAALWLQPDIWVGTNMGALGAFGPQYSFSGGRYVDKFTSPRLASGTWRIFAYWWAACRGGVIKNTATDNQVRQIVDLLLWDSISLVNNTGSDSTPINIKDSLVGASGPYADGTYHFGGIDGCGHEYNEALLPAQKVPAIRSIDIVVGKNAYLQAKTSSRVKETPALIFPITDFSSFASPYTNHYCIAGYWLSGCQCSAFLKSSLAFGY